MNLETAVDRFLALLAIAHAMMTYCSQRNVLVCSPVPSSTVTSEQRGRRCLRGSPLRPAIKGFFESDLLVLLHAADPAYGGVLHRAPQTAQISCHEPEDSFTPHERKRQAAPGCIFG